MANTKKSTGISKKDAKLVIIKKLESALADLKELMGEKKFHSRIKKASKLFTNIKTKAPKVKKAVPVKKKAANKAASKPKPAKKKS